jgi:hypothetical protein
VAVHSGIWVMHSNWKGVHVETIREFSKSNRIVHKVVISNENAQLDVQMMQSGGSPYDIGALLFDGIVLLCRRVLHMRKWPKINLWNSSGMFLCTELVTDFLYGTPDPLITPYKLYLKLKGEKNV